MTATCRKCSTPLNPGARFCRQCGTPVATAPSAQEQVLTQQLPGAQGVTLGESQAQPTAPAYLSPEMPAPWQQPTAQAPPSSGKKWLWILGGGFLAFLLVFVLIIATVVSRISRQARRLNEPVRVTQPGTSAGIEDAVLTSEQSWAFPADGTVEIENQRGNILIETWDRDQAQVQVYKRGGDAAEMNAVRSNIDVRGNRLVISTSYPSSSGVEVIYRVMVPRTVSLSQVSSVSGSINVSGVIGDVSIGTVSGDVAFTGGGGALSFQTVSGDLTVSLDPSAPPKAFKSQSVSGDLHVTMPEGVDGDLTFSSVSGNLNAQGKIDVNVTESPGHKSATAHIGNGGPAYRINSVSGDVNIVH